MTKGRYTALIAGYTGAVGGALARDLAGRAEWRVYGLARHPPAAVQPAATSEPAGVGKPAVTGVEAVTGVAADMADRDRLRRALAPLGGVTHLFYCGRATHAEQVIEDAAANLALLDNVVTATEAAAAGLRHVHLVQGGKYYGVHVGPFLTPAEESQPRAPIDNFNYDQQDYLSARAATARWTWSASRPNTLVHFSPAIARNLVSTLGAWAAICRELGAALDFPGPQGAYDSLTQLTTIELLARAIAWMATEPACANEAFNVTNTDLFRWHTLWPRLADAFAMPLGSVRPLRLAEVMAGRGELWRQICARHGLVQPDLDRVANWGYADATLERTWDEILSHNKARRLGFHDWDDSPVRFFTILDRYRQARILPH
ncbi:MAG: NAD-dependent epimerase/dehydratase family protein [Spirochaetaceae bacterium]|nr:NAD-dependent epimerase/dehydratase family protein [Spirochaetaceae bacterium]